MIRDNDWYNLNQQRAWPLDESATLLADDGTKIPAGILTDLSLTFSSELGRRAALSCLFVNNTAISLVIVSETGQPLAALTKAKSDLVLGYNYRLTSLHESASGWVAFGSSASTAKLNLRFTNPTQALLLPKVARGISTGRVTGLRYAGSDKLLAGDVKIEVGGDLQLTVENLIIDAVERQAVVFNLHNVTADPGRNVLSVYAGNCSTRPESGNCPDPQPITAIDNVVPNCCGEIYLEFRGCAEIGVVTDASGGFVLDCGQSLTDVCVSPNRLPDAYGKLPNEYDDLCTDKSDKIGFDILAVTRGADTGLMVVSLAENLRVDLPAGTTITLTGVVPDALNGSYELAEDTTAGSLFLTLTTAWTLDGSGGQLSYTPPTTTSGPDPDGTTPDGRTGLPWSYSFCSNNVTMWQVVNGGISLFGGDFGYNGLGGNIGSITPEPGDPTASVFSLQIRHVLKAGDLFAVFGCEEEAYNGIHSVREVEPASGLVIANTAWVVDALVGSWVAFKSPTVNDGGSTVGRIISIINNGSGKCLITFGEDHALVPNDYIVVTGNSVSAYCVRHKVTSTVGGTVGNTVVTDVNYTTNGTAGIYVIEKRRGGGRIIDIRESPVDNLLITTETPHGLVAGDDDIILLNSEHGLYYDTQYGVLSTPTATTAVIGQHSATGFKTASTQPCLWFLVGSAIGPCLVWQTHPSARNLAIWKPATAGITNWHSWNTSIETILRLHNSYYGTARISGGLVLNYQTVLVDFKPQTQYWFVELAYTPQSMLYVWKIKLLRNAADLPYFATELLLAHELNFNLSADTRYKLTVAVRPWDIDNAVAELVCTVATLDTVHSDTSVLQVSSFDGLGVPGLSANQAMTDFESVVIKELADA